MSAVVKYQRVVTCDTKKTMNMAKHSRKSLTSNQNLLVVLQNEENPKKENDDKSKSKSLQNAMMKKKQLVYLDLWLAEGGVQSGCLWLPLSCSL